MDPITSTIVWGVVWFFGIGLGGVAVYFAVFGIALLLTLLFDKEWIVALAVPVGWIFVVAWEIFAIVQVVIHVINLFKLLQGA